MPSPRRAGVDSPPRRYAPQLARLVSELPGDTGWAYELKYDGYRIGCRIEAGRVQLLSRNGGDWTARLAPIAAAAARLHVHDALLDGEAAIVLPDGRTSFQALQNAFADRRSAPGGTLAYFVFDLLHLDGEDLTALPLLERKARLARLLRRPPPPLHVAEHVLDDGARLLTQACRMGAEGIIAKRADQPYRAGRGPAWLKLKCIARQEFVIGGFTDPRGARSGLGALLIGTYDTDGVLHFAGKVGTGFSQRAALDLRQRLDRLERASSPFTPAPRGLGGGVHWAEPRLVAEITFGEWTADGKVRHPSFAGLRADKPPQQVQREAPAPLPKSTATPADAAARATAGGVSFSHPERVMWPDLHVTKLELARYYEAIGEWILPHLVGRPLTLVRCPEGIGKCFYMKHSGSWAPATVRRVAIKEKRKTGEYLIVDSLPALLALVQMNVVELHTWNATVDALERPDRLIFDLDPGAEVGWSEVVAAARTVREALTAIELPSLLKTTGGRGLHIVVPLQPAADWDRCLDFARHFAESLAALAPRRFTTRFAKRGRERLILLDYLRNNRANTAVAAYSVRARPGAPVSMPIAWDELRPAATPDRFTVRTALRRMRRLGRDAWTRTRVTPARLDAAVQRLATLR
jgi:bifunctional non-homologous end joining protein LigD